MNIFISHAEKDRSFAASLAKALTGAGMKVWAADAVQPGDNWALEAGKALASADAVVVLLSPDSVASNWIRKEIEFAITSPRFKDRLIPVLVRPTKEVPWILQELPQWIETDNPLAAARSISSLLKGRKSPTPARIGETR